MVVNYTEKIFKNYTKKYFSMKLQVNPLARTATPADFMLIDKKYFYFVECKQITVKDMGGCFDKNRCIRQIRDMLKLEEINPNIKTYFFIGVIYEDLGLKSHRFYLIRTGDLQIELDKINRRAIDILNIYDVFKEYLTDYRDIVL